MSTLKNILTRTKAFGMLFVFIVLMSSTTPAIAQVQSQQEHEFIQTLKELAWENYAIFEWHDLEIQRMGVLMRQRRLEMFEAFTISYNFFGLDADETFRPFVGLGVSLNLGRLFYTGARIRDARIMREQARAQKGVDRTQIAMEVIERYAFYKRSLELTELQAEALENNRQTMRLMQRQFEEGEIPLIEYQRATDAYMEDKKLYITNKNDLLKGKLELEELVGKRLEEIR